MKFLFLIGVEGSGHHMIRAVLDEFLALPEVIDVAECSWHRMLIDHWDPDVKEGSTKIFIRDKLVGRKTVKDKINAIFERDRKNGITHYFEPASFPFGQPRNTLRRPDLIEFLNWFGNTLEVKPLVLYRDPVSATYSALRRLFTDDWRLQARIVEDNYLFIERQLTLCGPEKFRVLNVEDFLTTPLDFSRHLADWWEIDSGLIERGLAHIIAPTARVDIPETIKKQLDVFFSRQRIDQWAGLHSRSLRLGRNHHAG